MEQIHATCIDVDGIGVLLRGSSGSGKSDLALRLIDGGGTLVADDRVDLDAKDGTLIASPPATLAGLFEARGVGIVKLPHHPRASIGLSVALVAADTVERLPDMAWDSYLGVTVPLLRLFAFEPSAPAKVRLAARRAAGKIEEIR